MCSPYKHLGRDVEKVRGTGRDITDIQIRIQKSNGTFIQKWNLNLKKHNFDYLTLMPNNHCCVKQKYWEQLKQLLLTTNIHWLVPMQNRKTKTV